MPKQARAQNAFDFTPPEQSSSQIVDCNSSSDEEDEDNEEFPVVLDQSLLDTVASGIFHS